MTAIRIRLDPDIDAWVRAEALRRRCSVAAVIRCVLAAAMTAEETRE